MDNISIDVVDEILGSRIALHDFGHPVKKVIAERTHDITAPTLLVVNLRKVNPMDYEFVHIAFGDLINFSQHNSDIYLVFQVDKGEYEELCTGMLDILDLKAKAGENEEQVLKDNGFSMIHVDENGKTNYLTALSEKHMNVLGFINLNGPVGSAEIQNEFNMIAEETSEMLAELKKSKFIHQVDGPKYVSVNSYLK